MHEDVRESHGRFLKYRWFGLKLAPRRLPRNRDMAATVLCLSGTIIDAASLINERPFRRSGPHALPRRRRFTPTDIPHCRPSAGRSTVPAVKRCRRRPPSRQWRRPMNEALLATRLSGDPAKARAAGADFDVLIVGAGLSGVGAACHFVRKRPKTSFAILETRDAIGGTWDLFRYPGIRSDSDMSTFGYAFRPWDDTRAIADGPSILRYLAETAKEYGVDRKIRFGHKVVRASWRSDDARWTLNVTGPGGEDLLFSCNFLFLCAGYYEYAEGYMPGWHDMERFAGRIVHPQKWPEDLRYAGKRVVVIGSGATAVTLVPAMAETAAHVVMLQRSPTYIVARPSEEAMAKRLGRWLPARLTHAILRWKNIALQLYLFRLSRRKPAAVRAGILKLAQAAVGPGIDAAKHFNPRYEPWDQRLCLVPDGDLFAALRAGKASVVTGEIETITETGLRLTSGEELEADIIVTATGLKLRLMGGIQIEVDGKPVEVGSTTIYKSVMLSDVPNLASVFG